MKKTLFSIASLAWVTFSAIRADAQNLYIGARIGSNLANQLNDSLGAYASSYGTEGITNGIHTGFLAGLQIDRHFDDMWGISAELLYDQKGTQVNYNESFTIVAPKNLEGPYTQTGTSDLTLNYLEVSLLLKVRFGSGDLRPYVFAGPSLGLFLSGKQQDNISYTESGSSGTLDTTRSIPGSDTKTFDASIVGGAGAELKLGSDQIIFVDAAYAYGFTNIAQSSDASVRSRDINLAAGILFPLD